METHILESQILYTSIFNPLWTSDLVNVLSEDDFTDFRNVYKAIHKLHSEGKKVGYVPVLALEPKTKDMIQCAVSEDNLGESILPNKKLFDERLDTLKEVSAKRQISTSFVNELDLHALKDKLEQIYKKGQSRWISGTDIKTLAYEIMQSKISNSVTYRISVLDKATEGLEKGQYIIVAGRPSLGKSSFLQCVGLQNSEVGKNVLFVSAEMSEDMIIKRILKTYKPETIPETFHVLIASDTPTIESEIQKKGRNFDLIIIDYIQLLKPKARYSGSVERVTNVSSDIKNMATKFNIPFLCASQFNREADKEQPTLSDLRESGALEQDADIVISLWRAREDSGLNIHQDKEKIRVDLLKNRNGYTFRNSDSKEYALNFDKHNFRFYEFLN